MRWKTCAGSWFHNPNTLRIIELQCCYIIGFCNLVVVDEHFPNLQVFVGGGPKVEYLCEQKPIKYR